jgi:hypothetical protein
MVERHGFGDYEKKDDDAGDDYYQTKKIYPFSTIGCGVMIGLIPTMGEVFPRHNIGYLAVMIKCNVSYLKTVLDYLVDAGFVTNVGDSYFLSFDNLRCIESALKMNSIVVLAKKIEEIEG